MWKRQRVTQTRCGAACQEDLHEIACKGKIQRKRGHENKIVLNSLDKKKKIFFDSGESSLDFRQGWKQRVATLRRDKISFEEFKKK